MTPWRDSHDNRGRYFLTVEGARVVVVHHEAARTGAQDDCYEVVDFDTGAESMRAGYQWAAREIPMPRFTRYELQAWTGHKWSRQRQIEGLGTALRHAAKWSALGFDVRVTCGGIVIDEQRGVIRKAA